MDEDRKPKYINPLTDFGFKRIFGTEANVDLLIDFLNCMLPLSAKIVSLTYKNVEQVPNTTEDRKVIYDVFCIDSEGKELIIEMQKSKITYFKDRALFYLTFPIQSQALKGSEWNFKLKPIYYLSLLDFTHEPLKGALLEREIQLKDQENKVFYDKLYLKFVQLPLFDKQEHELITRKDKWLYYLKNLENMQESIPALFASDTVFKKALTVSEIAALKPDEYQNYQVSRMQYLEIRAALETAFLDGQKKFVKAYKIVKIAIKRTKKEVEEAKIEIQEAKQEVQEAKQEIQETKLEAAQKIEAERRKKEDAELRLLNVQKSIAKKQISKGLSLEEVADMLEIAKEQVESWLKEE